MENKDARENTVAGRTYVAGNELFCWICAEFTTGCEDGTEEYGNDECCNCERDIETGMTRDELFGRVPCEGPVWKDGEVLRKIK